MEDQELRMVSSSFPKRLWKVVQVFLYMLKKGICKKKLLLDVNLLLKRGKLAGKAALVNLTFFHHSSTSNAGLFSFFTASSGPPAEYEFSCSNTPTHPNFLLHHVIPTLNVGGSGKKKGGGRYNKGAQAGRHYIKEEEMAAALQLMMAVEASPLLPGLGFGRSPLVRQLRVTDSPFPISAASEGDCHVDEAAEEFIKRFYSQLRTQSLTDS